VVGKLTGGPEVSARVGKGLFERRLAEIRKAGEGLPNAYDPAGPSGSATRFTLTQLLATALAGLEAPGELQAATRIISKLPADAFAGPAAAPGEAFVVPQAAPHPMAEISVSAIFPSQELFPHDSWPVVLSRELALAICGKGADMSQLDALIRGGEVGPVSCLAMANVFRLLNMLPVSRELAKEGLRQLKPEGFRKDASVVVSGEGLLGKMISALAAALRESSDDDIQAVASRLNPPEAALLLDSARMLKASPEKPLADAIAPALDSYWRAALHQGVGEALSNCVFGPE